MSNRRPMFMNWWSEDFLRVRSRKEFNECIEDHSVPMDHYGSLENMTIVGQFELGRRIEDIAEDLEMAEVEVESTIRVSMRQMRRKLQEKFEAIKLHPAKENKDNE